MAIVNGKRLYNSEKLQAVAREDDRAVAEYSWLMAGISDDFGRFKMSPRRILGKAYAERPGVNELTIGDWLALYEKHGLLKLYTVGGSTYAEWTNYMGDPPSRRHFHSCPEPEWTKHKHNKRCIFRDDVAGMQLGRRVATQSATSVATQSPTPPLLSVPSVPSVPSVRRQEAEPPAHVPPAFRAEKAIYDSRSQAELKLLHTVAILAEKLGRDPPGVMVEVTSYKREDGKIVKGRENPADLGTVERVKKSLEDAEGWLADLEGGKVAAK